MSISRRTAARSVRLLGVTAASAALVFGAVGSALATDLKDFSAEAACDGAKGVITVTDKDKTATPAVVSVFLENNGADLRKVGELPVAGSAKGVTVTFAEDWEPGAVYRVHVTTADLNADLELLTTPAKACKGDTPSTPPTTPSTSPSPSPSDSASASAPAEPGTQAPSDSASESTAPAGGTGTTDNTGATGENASNAPSPAVGESNLAETGANSNTPLIVSIAVVLVAVGGGAIFFGLRRKGSSNR
ncbi:LAETG motif-containing sortase-dependent surface protein [Streptomyces sp. A012304]|uniref:LAETG motif-containing sortase-dependent surface protein n=1 Tax=Streptomyces sp. A012304 TaxID=375446 RepID=UPI0022312287|nr:LAETG motif-containing sortase-dependent surface protein [Streptomyces sp. A012304]GKQ41212.1 alpha-ketoglutarate decarboxylase [Streptomyces sp. A012304]